MIIVSRRYGGMCNRLFLSAYALALGKALGQSVLLPTLMERGDYFISTRHRLLCPWPGSGGWVRWPVRLRFLARRLVRVAASTSQALWPRSLIQLDYEQTPQYRLENSDWLARFRQPWTFLDAWLNLAEIEIPLLPEITRFFTLEKDLRDEVERHLAPIRQETDILIGVHWRRGDYAEYLRGRYFYLAPVYRRVMAQVQSFFPDRRVTFLVCSNEPVKDGDFASFRVALGPGTEVTDLYALASCDYLLGPPSTFSLWASFSGRKPLWFITQADDTPTSLADFKVAGPTFNQFRITSI